MPRGVSLKPNEITKAVRIRAPKTILRKLERLTPAQIGAWVYHSETYFEQHEPNLSLEQPPAPIPDTAFEKKPMNPRLAEILRQAKPSNWTKLGNRMRWTPEELEADEAFWQGREQERQQERAMLMRELELDQA
jgi:hypothetical protein